MLDNDKDLEQKRLLELQENEAHTLLISINKELHDFEKKHNVTFNLVQLQTFPNSFEKGIVVAGVSGYQEDDPLKWIES